MIFNSVQQIDERIAKIRYAADKTLQAMRTLLSTPEHGSLEILRRMKFTTAGHDAEGAPMNLVEQINVTFTDLVTLQAARWLLKRHADVTSLRVSLGSTAGIDIESDPSGVIAAEAFAAVHPRNNRKLAKDLAKLEAIHSVHRYAFFCSPAYPDLARQTALETVPGVEVWSLPSEHLLELPS